jgi:hypothetical protein
MTHNDRTIWKSPKENEDDEGEEFYMLEDLDVEHLSSVPVDNVKPWSSLLPHQPAPPDHWHVNVGDVVFVCCRESA